MTRYFDGLVQYGEGYDHRIQFSGDVDSGDISITITAVTMDDNGTYACSVRLREDPPRESALLDLFVLGEVTQALPHPCQAHLPFL